MKFRKAIVIFMAATLLFAGCERTLNNEENDMKHPITDGTETLIKYPEYPEGSIPRDYDYAVRVIQGDKAIELPVYNPVYASDYFNRDTNNWDQHRRYAEFAFSGDPVTVEITVHNNFSSYSVMPSSKAIPSKIDGNVVTYTLTEPCTTVFKINNDKDTHLTIFAEKPETNKPDKNDENVIYYEAGYHEVEGGVVNLKSNQILYLEPGALLKARLNVEEGTENVKVCGRGAFIESSSTRLAVNGVSYMCMVNNTKNLLIEDVRFLDAHTFNIVTVNGKNLNFNGVKVLSNQISTDGFSIWSAAHGVHFNNCYFNISDNAFVIGGGEVKDFLVENTMIITDYAFLFPQGRLTGDPLVFKNIDVLRYGSFMKHEYPETPGQKDVDLVLENCCAIDTDRSATVLRITYGLDAPKKYVFKNVALPALAGTALYITSDEGTENASITFDNVWTGQHLLTDEIASKRMKLDRTKNEVIFTDTNDETAVTLKRNDVKLSKEVVVYTTYIADRKLESKYQPYEKDGKVYVSAYEILDALLFNDIKLENDKLTFNYKDEKYEIAVADEKAMVDTETLSAAINTAITVENKKITVANIKREDNLLRNPDFEDGLSMDWVTRNFTKLYLSEDAQSGKYAIRATNYSWGADGGIYQDIDKIIRQYGKGHYKITAWVKKADASCDSTYARLGVTSEWSINSYKQIDLTDEWQQIEYTYSYNGDPATLKGLILVIGYCDGSNRNLLIDNVSLTRLN